MLFRSYEAEIPLVRVGARATVTFNAYPNERFTGRVLYVYPFVDEKTRTNKVRYELNNRYRRALERAGLRVVGEYQRNNLAEIVEFKGHPWFVAVQYHPELQSRPLHPHPLFREFIRAALRRLQ